MTRTSAGSTCAVPPPRVNRRRQGSVRHRQRTPGDPWNVAWSGPGRPAGTPGGGGRCPLLLAGLDHRLPRSNFPGVLARLFGSVQWRACPVWLAGRPYAFEACWPDLFADPAWEFLRVEPLAKAEVRFYLARNAG